MTANGSPDSQDVAQKAVRAAFWNYASFGLGKGLVFITTVILARLLSVDDFGTVAFATLIITYLTVFKDLGLGSALIQRRENIDEAANSVFSLNIILGVILALICYLIAPQVAIFFRDPTVTPLLRVLGITFVFNGLAGTHAALLQKELAFKQKLIPDISRSVVKGVVSIGLALAGAGVWALVIGQVVSAAVGMIATWIAYPWRPKWRIDTGLARALLRFGLSVFSVNIIAIMADNLDYLVIGRILGSEDLGLYTMAYRLPELLILNVLWILAAVLFPAYSLLKDNEESLRSGFLVTLRYVELVIVPISLGLLLAADPIVRVAFGSQWIEAIPVVRVLALFALVSSIGFNVGDLYKAIGRPDILMKIEFFTLGLLLPTLLIAVRYGILGVAFGHLGVAVIHMMIRLVFALRHVRITPRDILAQLQPSLVAGAILTVFAVAALQLTASLNPLVRLLIVTFVGAVGYLGTLWVIERDTVLRASRLVGIIPHEKTLTL